MKVVCDPWFALEVFGVTVTLVGCGVVDVLVLLFEPDVPLIVEFGLVLLDDVKITSARAGETSKLPAISDRNIADRARIPVVLPFITAYP